MILDVLRVNKDGGPLDTVKLPVCDDILDDMRTRLWFRIFGAEIMIISTSMTTCLNHISKEHN